MYLNYRQIDFHIQRKAAFLLVFLLILLFNPSAIAAELNLTINQIDNSKFPTVTAYATVLDAKNNPISGLTETQFELYESGIPVSAFNVASVFGGGQGIAVVLAIDTSGSMRGKPMEDSRQAAVNYINRMGDFDQAAIVGFDDEARTIQTFTKDKSVLAVAINSLKAGGRYTVLNDAIYDSVSAAAQLPPG